MRLQLPEQANASVGQQAEETELLVEPQTGPAILAKSQKSVYWSKPL